MLCFLHEEGLYWYSKPQATQHYNLMENFHVSFPICFTSINPEIDENNPKAL